MNDTIRQMEFQFTKEHLLLGVLGSERFVFNYLL